MDEHERTEQKMMQGAATLRNQRISDATQDQQGQEAAKALSGRPYRPTARDAAHDLVRAYQLRMNQLDALNRAMPGEMSFPADEALRSLLVQELEAMQHVLRRS